MDRSASLLSGRTRTVAAVVAMLAFAGAVIVLASDSDPAPVAGG